MSDTRFGTFGELLATTEPELQQVVERLREIVIEIDSNTVEVVRLGDRAATYSIGPKKMIQSYVYILPHTNWVNLGFYRGVYLKDPDGSLEGTGKIMRHVKVRSVEDAGQPALRKLIQEAFDEGRQAFS